MRHAFINLVIPFHRDHCDRAEEALRDLIEPEFGNRPKKYIEEVLTDIGSVHFMTVTVVRPGSPAHPETQQLSETAHLLIEVSADGGSEEVVDVLATGLGPQLRKVLAAARIELGAESLSAFLLRHRRVIEDKWFGDALGQVFTGSPGMSARRICREAELAERARRLVDRMRNEKEWAERSPRQRLDAIRDVLWDAGDTKWAFVPEAAPCIAGDPHNKWNATLWQFVKAGSSILHKLLWPVYSIILLLCLIALVYKLKTEDPITSLLWSGGVLLVLLAALALAGGIAYQRLRRLEEADPAEEITPPEPQVRQLMRVENFCAQNHLASVSLLKPGLLRKLALHVAFVVVSSGRFVAAPGFLGRNGVIHFARWMRLPGTDQLLFWSNYDGTWESYVGDFIADAPSGVTGIWSNCVGFPRARGLFGKGATNRDRLVNWARRQQHPTTFWYSAYRDLTAERIRINAEIRQGLASAASDADARDWLALFGSAPLPAGSLQISQIPALVFGGLSPLRYSACHFITFAASPSACREWLARAAEQAAYGEMLPGQLSAVVVALSAGGLTKLGVPPDALATFPVAFQQGMAHESRARVLQDTGDNDPVHWSWGNAEKPVDVLLAVYGRTPHDLEKAQSELLSAAEKVGQVRSQPLAELRKYETQPADQRSRPTYVEPAEALLSKDASQPADQRGRPRYKGVIEPFGFTDGVSQPIIRGAPGWNKRWAPEDHSTADGGLGPLSALRVKTRGTADNLVEPGEIVLGYPDNIGTIPPTPSIADQHDPKHLLPDAGTDPQRRRPEFSRYQGSGRRDLGANGTFLVVRKIEQNVKKFEDWLEGVVDRLEAEGIVAATEGDRVALLWGAKAQDEADAPLPRPRRSNLTTPAVPLDPAERKKIKDAIAAKLVGRWKDGTSLVRYPLTPGTEEDPLTRPDNAFLFGAEDPAGQSCPFGAHIRRANPRDARFPKDQQEIATTNRHRILRVGRPYGPLGTKQDGQGLLFMCLNADIARQFEFIQRTWLLNPNLHGLEDEIDPILGQGPKIVTLPTPTGPIRLGGLPTIVTVKGGEYFFLPGRAALRYLASQPLGDQPAATPPTL